MATSTTNKIDVTELDFDLIKSSLKSYMRGQSEFTDYDFDSSGLSVLLDVLAYNTHYNGFYANMIANEMFLDSAALRNSVVSRAKELGYVPRSPTGAIATVDVTFTIFESAVADYPATIAIPANHVFSATIENKVYTYLATKSYAAVPTSPITSDSVTSGVQYKASGVMVREGISTSIQYIVGNEGTDQKFQIPNIEADTSTLDVVITDAVSGTSSSKWTSVADTTSVGSSDNVYWLQEGFDSKYEIYFGDGQVGRKPEPGSIVTMNYNLTKEDLGNGATIFECDPIPIETGVGTYPRPSTGDSVLDTATIKAAAGGAPRESISSIKFLAPLNYESQSRSVTVNDYKTKLTTSYPNIDAIRVWGGEENTPPDYGAVYMSIKPKSGYILSDTDKSNIISEFITPSNVVTIRPVLVDPKYIYIQPTVIVKYDSKLTTQTPASLAKIVSLTILDFAQNNLENFEAYFKSSQLSQQIDISSTAITNNLMNIKIRVEFVPISTNAGNYTVELSNPIYHPHATHEGSVTSSSFTYFSNTLCTLRDYNGVMQVISSTGEVLNANVGTIKYDNGTINLVGFLPTVNAGDSISIIAKPEHEDIVPSVDQLITIQESEIVVSMVDDSSTLQGTLMNPAYGNVSDY